MGTSALASLQTGPPSREAVARGAIRGALQGPALELAGDTGPHCSQTHAQTPMPCASMAAPAS